MAMGQLAHAVTDTLLSGASPLPHVDCVVPGGRACANWPQTSAKSWAPDNDSLMYIKNVGGGLLPMAVGQLAHAVADTLLSGASPLPHLDCVVPGGRACANWPQTSAKSWVPDNDSLMDIKMWEGACSRWRWVSLHMQWLTLCYREQAPSHIWTVLCLEEERARTGRRRPRSHGRLTITH
ncbi:hypothetical protein ACVWXD_005445 [Pseudomonas sp. TE3911]